MNGALSNAAMFYCSDNGQLLSVHRVPIGKIATWQRRQQPLWKLVWRAQTVAVLARCGGRVCSDSFCRVRRHDVKSGHNAACWRHDQVHSGICLKYNKKHRTSIVACKHFEINTFKVAGPRNGKTGISTAYTYSPNTLFPYIRTLVSDFLRRVPMSQ